MWPGPLSPTSTAAYGNPVLSVPLPEPPEFSTAQTVERRTGMWCGCLLLDCCHNEIDGTWWNHGEHGRHVDSGSPASGYLYPWEPGDESWRDETFCFGLTRGRMTG
jgi:hypothetical protein